MPAARKPAPTKVVAPARSIPPTNLSASLEANALTAIKKWLTAMPNVKTAKAIDPMPLPDIPLAVPRTVWIPKYTEAAPKIKPHIDRGIGEPGLSMEYPRPANKKIEPPKMIHMIPAIKTLFGNKSGAGESNSSSGGFSDIRPSPKSQSSASAVLIGKENLAQMIS